MNTGMLSVRSMWLVTLAAAAILMVTMGIRMSLGLFVEPIAGSTGMSIADISFALAVSQLMWGVSQPLTGAAADRFWTKRACRAWCSARL